MLFLISPLGAEVTLTLQAPLFTGLNATRQKEVEDQLSSRQTELLDLIKTTLNKPRFMGAFAKATALKPGLSSPWLFPHALGSMSLKIDASGVVDTWNLADLVTRAQGLNQDSDESWGGAASPLGGEILVKLPFPGMDVFSMRLGGSYFPISLENYEGAETSLWTGFEGTLGGGYMSSGWSWEGFRGSLGMNWQRTRVKTSIPMSPIIQIVDVQLPGFFVPVPMTIEIYPAVNAGIETSGLNFPVLVETAFSFLETFTFSAGGGLSFGRSVAGFYVDGKADVTLPVDDRGFITDGNGVEHPGKVSLEGTLDEFGSPPVNYFLLGGVQLNMGTFLFHIPILWSPPYDVSLGISLGISL